jgi:hypothetical protein
MPGYTVLLSSETVRKMEDYLQVLKANPKCMGAYLKTILKRERVKVKYLNVESFFSFLFF